MTVEQLIAALRDMPPEATVGLDSVTFGSALFIEGVELGEEGDVWLTEGC